MIETMSPRRMYVLVSVWLLVVPAVLSVVGHTFYGVTGGVIGLVSGLVPGMCGYFMWLKISGFADRPEPSGVYADSHVGDNF